MRNNASATLLLTTNLLFLTILTSAADYNFPPPPPPLNALPPSPPLSLPINAIQPPPPTPVLFINPIATPPPPPLAANVTLPTTPPPTPVGTCPTNTLKLGVCAGLLNGLVNQTVGTPPNSPCCPILQGFVDFEAAVCLCTAIKANVLGPNVNIPLSISLLLNYCGKDVPSGFQCV